MSGFVKNRGGIVGVADVDMPREKLERLGPEALRDEELLAILLRTGYEGPKCSGNFAWDNQEVSR